MFSIQFTIDYIDYIRDIRDIRDVRDINNYKRGLEKKSFIFFFNLILI